MMYHFADYLFSFGTIIWCWSLTTIYRFLYKWRIQSKWGCDTGHKFCNRELRYEKRKLPFWKCLIWKCNLKVGQLRKSDGKYYWRLRKVGRCKKQLCFCHDEKNLNNFVRCAERENNQNRFDPLIGLWCQRTKSNNFCLCLQYKIADADNWRDMLCQNESLLDRIRMFSLLYVALKSFLSARCFYLRVMWMDLKMQRTVYIYIYIY